MASQIEKDPLSPFESQEFHHRLSQYYRSTIQAFRKIISAGSLFRLVFGALFLAEALILPLLFSSYGALSLLFVMGLSCLFLTLFTYLVLHFYFQAKKPDDLRALHDQFLSSCRQVVSLPEGEVHHHLTVAEALSKLAGHLDGFEESVQSSFGIARLTKPLFSLMRQCKEDLFSFKRLLLDSAIEEHLKQIRVTPTDLEVHASLANSYIALSRLHKDVGSEEKFRTLAELAMEEFKILRHYAPHDPWVHEQLSAGYHDLGRVQEEIEEVEILSKLRPQDKEILYRLGTLYFQQGMNAKGLQVYEELKLSHYKKAESLIDQYGRIRERA